jgi:hypothetical protein
VAARPDPGQFQPSPLRRPAGPDLRPIVALILVFVALAFVKPWAGPEPSGAGGGASLGRATRPTQVAAPTPTPTPEPSQDPTSAFCIGPTGWLVFDVDRWQDRTIRSWRAFVPARERPADPAALPVVPVPAEAVLGLGYCAPSQGDDPPPTGATLALWELEPDGSTRPMALPERLLPPAPTANGIVLAAPAAPRDRPAAGASWPSGRYLFVLRDPRSNWSRRWVVEVSILPIDRAAPPG